jgi:hypothetical protein
MDGCLSPCLKSGRLNKFWCWSSAVVIAQRELCSRIFATGILLSSCRDCEVMREVFFAFPLLTKIFVYWHNRIAYGV